MKNIKETLEEIDAGLDRISKGGPGSSGTKGPGTRGGSGKTGSESKQYKYIFNNLLNGKLKSGDKIYWKHNSGTHIQGKITGILEDERDLPGRLKFEISDKDANFYGLDKQQIEEDFNLIFDKLK